MALLFMDGFDAGDLSLKWRANGGASTTAAGGRFGTGRYVLVNGGAGIFYDLPTAASQVFVGLAIGANSLDTTLKPVVTFLGDGQTTQHLSVAFSTNVLQLKLGTVNGTLLASHSANFIANVFYHLEISATIADSGGTCVVKLNGQTVINYTGDTKNGGTNTTIDSVGIMTNNGANTIADDVYICDSTGGAPYNTFLGDARVQTIVPNGAGSSTQFTASTGANYTTVDELPYSATDYVSSSTSGHRDTYALGDIGTVTTVHAVQNNIIAKKTDTSALSIKSALKSNTTVSYGSNVSLGTSDAVIRDLRITDPDTAAAWTQSGVNALESGFEVV